MYMHYVGVERKVRYNNLELDSHHESKKNLRKKSSKIGGSNTPALTRDGKYRRHDGEA